MISHETDLSLLVTAHIVPQETTNEGFNALFPGYKHHLSQPDNGFLMAGNLHTLWDANMFGINEVCSTSFNALPNFTENHPLLRNVV